MVWYSNMQYWKKKDNFIIQKKVFVDMQYILKILKGRLLGHHVYKTLLFQYS